jgi:hypothetical protein
MKFIHHELTCPRPNQQKWVFWQMQKLRFLILEKFYSFQYFVDFSTDLDSPDLKFFRTGPRFA